MIPEETAPHEIPVIEPEPAQPNPGLLAMILGSRFLSYRYQMGKHTRAGVTKNHGRKRNKVRAAMAKESRRMNRVR